MTTRSAPATLSVLMPNYNHARFLTASLGAILEQSYRPLEVIVLDDSSTDNSTEIIQEFARRDPVVKLVRHDRNQGVEASVNELLSLAKGDYLYSPAADDKVLPGFFEKSMRLLSEFPQAGLCSTVGRLIAEDGGDKGVRSLPVVRGRPSYLSPSDVRHVLCRYGRWIDAGAVIYRRDAFAEIGQIEELGSFADTFSNLVIALRYGACYVPEPLNCFRQMAGGYASRNAYDWESLLSKGVLAARLMRTTYADLFPEEYVRRFEAHWTYGAFVSGGRSMRRQQQQTLSEVTTAMLQDTSGVDRTFVRVMYAIGTAQAALWRSYAMLRFGAWKWWLRGRLSVAVNLKRLALIDRFDF